MKTLIALIAFCAPAVCRAEITPADILAALASSSPASAVQPPRTDGATSLREPARDFYLESEIVAAGQQPTPMAGVNAGLRLLNLTPQDVFLDLGCGFDCRWGITAAKVYGCKVIAVEIDPAMAQSARRYVERAGLAHLVEVRTGDAATMTFPDANKGAGYLWVEGLATLAKHIEKLDRFVSYSHPIPGLPTSKVGDLYLFEKPQPMAVVRNTVATWNGQTYTHARCSNPNCAMCNSIRQQLSTYRSVPVSTSSQPSGHYETRQVKVCRRGPFGRTYCSYQTQRVWVSDAG